MKNETKKYIAREILILIFSILIIIIFYLSLLANNLYQKQKHNKLVAKYNYTQLNNDSVKKEIEKYTIELINYRKIIFNQLGRINSEGNQNTYTEKIGESKNIQKSSKWDKYIIDPLDILSVSQIALYPNGNKELPVFYNFNSFDSEVKISSNFRLFIFNLLKSKYDSTGCENINLFNLKIGAKKSSHLNSLLENSGKYDKDLIELKKDINYRSDRIINQEYLNYYTLSFLYILFFIVFFLRYLYIIIRWSINTLKVV